MKFQSYYAEFQSVLDNKIIKSQFSCMLSELHNFLSTCGDSQLILNLSELILIQFHSNHIILKFRILIIMIIEFQSI